MSFFDKFNHIVPYFVKVSVGKKKRFRKDPTKKSNLNHQGKMVAVSKKSKTREELKIHGLGEYMEYVPAEQVSMPIELQIASDERLLYCFDKTTPYTNRKETKHVIYIYNEDEIFVGSVELMLTPAGDIAQKWSSYESPDGTENIGHIIFNEMRDGELVKDECFEFTKSSDTGTKKVKISQRDGRIVGCSVKEQDLETREDIWYQSITKLSTDEKTPKIRTYVASCVCDESDISKRGGLLLPWECQCLEGDLLEYQKKQRELQQYLDEIKQKSNESLSIDDIIELNNRRIPLKDLKEKIGNGPAQTINYHAEIAQYLKGTKNKLKDYKGEYIGNILRLTKEGYEACVVTKHPKDGNNYRLYYLIDLRGVKISEGSMLEYVDRDQEYYNRIGNPGKTPTFVTEIGQDGTERLVLHNGERASGECPQYKEFVQDFIAPFSEIKPVKISQILDRDNDNVR